MKIAAKPTRYNGVEFKSRLEARFAEMLTHKRMLWEYEPLSAWFGTYQPDFYLRHMGHQGLYVEIKPREYIAELQMFWNAIWSAPVPWVCIDKAHGFRDQWVIIQGNSRFKSGLQFSSVTVPVSFKSSGDLHYLEIETEGLLYSP
jgi:hypothetical protein